MNTPHNATAGPLHRLVLSRPLVVFALLFLVFYATSHAILQSLRHFGLINHGDFIRVDISVGVGFRERDHSGDPRRECHASDGDGSLGETEDAE